MKGTRVGVVGALAVVGGLGLLATALPAPAAHANQANDILVAGMSDQPTSLDPARGTLGIEEIPYLYAIYDELIDFNPNTLELRPGLATAWKWSDDKLALTLTLRHGVKFQDGADLNAAAVKTSLTHYMTAGVNRELSVVTGIDTPADDTVVLHVASPNSALAGLLADRPGMIVSPAALAKYNNNLDRNPVGAGPYKFVSWTVGNNIQLARFDDYWGGKPRLAGIDARIIQDPTARVSALQSGQLDYAAAVDTVNLPVLRKNPRLKVSLQQTIAYSTINLNTGNTTTGDKLVRQAIQFAIDRKAIGRAVYGPGVDIVPALTPSPPSYWTGTPALANAYSYAPDKALALLKQAGHPEGVTVDMCGAAQGGLTPAKQVMDIMQAEMKPAGITLNEVIRANTAGCIQLFDSGGVSGFVASWSGRPNMWQTYQLQLATHTPYNIANTVYPGVAESLQKVLDTPDPKAEKPYFDELNKEWIENAPQIPLYFFVNLVVTSKTVGGLPAIPLLRPYMKSLYFEKG